MLGLGFHCGLELLDISLQLLDITLRLAVVVLKLFEAIGELGEASIEVYILSAEQNPTHEYTSERGIVLEAVAYIPLQNLPHRTQHPQR